jgi:hypothetical protein
VHPFSRATHEQIKPVSDFFRSVSNLGPENALNLAPVLQRAGMIA